MRRKVNYVLGIVIPFLIIELFVVIPGIGFYNIGNKTITLLYSLVIISAIISGYLGGIINGFWLGLLLFLYARFSGREYFNTGFYQVYNNFIVAVLPSLIIGIITHLWYQAFKPIIKNFIGRIVLISTLVMTVFEAINILFAVLFASETFNSIYGAKNGWAMLLFDNNNWLILELFANVIIVFIVLYIGDLFGQNISLQNDDNPVITPLNDNTNNE